MNGFRFAAAAIRLCFCVITLIAALDRHSAGADKPLNVLLIVADDQDCQLGCYGNSIIKTPNLDRLAAMGVRFDRAYCNYPVCNASRTSFLSGRYPNTTQVFGNNVEPRATLGPDFKFLPEEFQANGYFAGAYGKIAHGAFATTIRWDEFADPQRGSSEGARQRRAGKAERRAAAEKGTKLPFAWSATGNADEDEPDGQTATQVIKLLEDHREGPFFIAAGFHKPHVPHTAPKKYFDMYNVDDMPLPIEPTGHAEQIPAIGRAPNYFPDLTEEQQRQIVQHYYAASTFMDAQVGRLLDAMDRLKLWDNTIVVFLGDHGWHLGEHGGFWAKMSLMSESGRAPFIIYAPGRSANKPCGRVVEFVDLFPTLTELAGIKSPDGLQGRSLAPLLDNPASEWNHAAFGVVTRGGKLGRSLWTEEYTYLAWPDGSRQLYQFRSDPKEYVNLAANPELADVVRKLQQQLDDGPTAGEMQRPRGN